MSKMVTFENIRSNAGHNLEEVKIGACHLVGQEAKCCGHLKVNVFLGLFVLSVTFGPTSKVI